MKMPGTSDHRFSTVPSINIQRSKFDRSHGYKTTFDSGYLVPVFLDEVLPGDTFNLRANFFARLTTPLKPILDNMYLESFFFFVPYRLLWTNWEKFNGAQVNPGDSTSFVIPTVPMAVGGSVVGTLHDYFGIPSGAQITAGFNVCAFPSRAYNKIWNEWFRSEDLQNSLTVDTGDGPDVLSNYVLKRRNKRHDYFTSVLPWPQKGTAVTIPAGASSAPVWGDGANPFQLKGVTSGALGQLRPGGAGSTVAANYVADSGTFSSSELMRVATQAQGTTGLIADLSSAFATTINAFRLAAQTQVLLERDARGGTRYTEILKNHFGVTSPDFRLQRSEYLGGGSSPVNIHPVPMTAAASGVTPAGQQGNLAAFGTASAVGHGFNKSFTEHGLVMGLINVRADLTYQQGVDRMWSRSTRYDFYWPSLAQIGEQGVLMKEIYCQGTATDTTVFGYQERYSEYRRKLSLITGKFRSDYATPLDVWHLSQRFTSTPSLGDTFIQENPPVSRVVAVTTEPQFFLDSFFKLICARPMPVYGIPQLGSRM